MSKIIQKLKNLSKTAQPVLGFRPASAAEASSRVLIVAKVAEVSPDTGAYLAECARAGVDAAILPVNSGGNDLKGLLKQAGDMPVGLAFEAADSGRFHEFAGAGFDFAVFDVNASMAILDDKDMAKVLVISHGTGIEQFRAVSELEPVIDGVLVEGHKQGFVPIEHLLTFRRVTRTAGKPVWAELPVTVSEAEFKAIWEGGVDVFVLPGSPPVDAMMKIKAMARSLPSGGRKPWGVQKRPVPILPQIHEPAKHEADEEGEEEEEE